MAYEVYITESFEKRIETLPNKKLIQKVYSQLKQNPYVGDQIRYTFFREKRIYYLIYEDLKLVLMVAIGGKKEQSQTIDEIITKLPEFRDYVKQLF
jgi:hypothetical protein